MLREQLDRGADTMTDNPDTFAAAEADVLQLLRREPENADGLLRLGWLRLRQRDWAGAREALLHAHVLQPRSPIIRIYATHALSACHDDRAPQMLADWRNWLPLPDKQQLDLALAMRNTDWSAEAIDVLQDLLARSPGDRWAKITLAALYERVNRLDEADAIVAEMLSDAANNDAALQVELLHQQAVLLKRKGELALAREVLERAGPRTVDDAAHYFELAQLADRQHDESAAMRYLGHAHARERKELARVALQRLEHRESVFSQIGERMTATDALRWPQLMAPDARQSPVFVVGFPRSGTTLMEQMLDAHPALQAMDERPYFTMLMDQLEEHGVRVPRQLDQLTQADCDELRKGYLMLACTRIERQWDRQLVDKNPLNMLRLPLIHRMFPNARFIMMLRHPGDVLISNYLQNYRSAAMMAASLSLESLATAYVQAFDYWFHHAALLKPAVLEVRYEELVVDPNAQAIRLAAWLELGDASPMLRVAQHARDKGFIGTPSYIEVIEPIHGRAVGRWQRYRPWLGDALRILAPMLPRVGYAVTDGD
jgi:tetratricopeptide (TPR) repeat protein